MNRGVFITFEGTEGGGKSTQLKLLTDRLRATGREITELREPGGTPVGEEIRHLLKHSEANRFMTPEAELLLLCASRAQLVREIIRPALAAGRIVLCDRFHDSTIAYQGYGRQLELGLVRSVVDFAVGDTRPHLTLMLHLPVSVSEQRRGARAGTAPRSRDRFEEADREFFKRVEAGFRAVAAAEPARVRVIDATQPVESVAAAVWREVAPIVA